MIRKLAMAFAVAGSLAFPAMARETTPAHPLDLTLREAPREGMNDVLGVSSTRPVAQVILTDALYGGLAGAAIGAGVALINGNDYGRDIAIGAGVGIVAGGIVGAVDGMSHDRMMMPGSEGTNRMQAPTFSYGGKY